MSTTLCLLPNFGAEDGSSLRDVDPELARGLAACWALLYPADVDAIGLGPLQRPSWVDPCGVALPLLKTTGGLLPWLSTTAAEEEASLRGLPYLGADPRVTSALSDKAWALAVAEEESLVPPCLVGVVRSFSPDDLLHKNARDHIDEALASWPPPLRERFVLKPRRGSSGRGRVAGKGGHLDDAGARGLRRLAARGGALLEPWLPRTHDLSAQLHIATDGEVSLTGTTAMRSTSAGLWAGNDVVWDALDGDTLRSGSPHDVELRRAALLIGARAARAGYRGLLGVDAFAFTTPAGEVAFRPVVEVNARPTMGAVALGLGRRNAVHRRS
ncbi:MAG: hypothetical protein ACO3JL_07385, partial [Myxococcota bacterium]